jgi:RHS repeat-associated protein
MFKNILIITGLICSIAGYSQKILNGYSAPQTVVDGTAIRLLPGFHANSSDGSYTGADNKFIAKISSTEPSIPPNPTIGNTNTNLGENYVYSRSYLVPVNTSNANAPQIQSITYFDGLGRPKQNISIKSTPLGNDLVTPILYDDFGRQTREYLPIPQLGTQSANIYPQNSNLVDFPVTNSTGIYETGEKIFSEKTFDDSPLDKILEVYGIGADWRNSSKSNLFDYQTNPGNEVLRFVAKESTIAWTEGITHSKLSLAAQHYYPSETLYMGIMTDEDGIVSYEFKNGQGQTIMVRKEVSAMDFADTYYVYNEYDQLAFIVSPLASETIKANLSISQNILDELCYQYRYDGRNRLAEKKLPGQGLDSTTGTWHWESMVYDKQDRLVMTQDANLNKEEQWIFTKYEQFGRVAYTGITLNSGTRSDLQTTFDGKGSNNVARTGDTSGFTFSGLIVYYDNDSAKNYPNTISKLLSVNYYDTYPKDKPDLSTLEFTQAFITDNAQANNVSTKSLPVASYLNNTETNSWTKTFSYYNDQSRPTATYSKNHLGGRTQTESTLDFAGVTQKTITKHKRKSSDATDVIIQERFVYDHQNRMLQNYHQVDSKSEVLLTENAYDELSRLDKKKVGNNLQEITYAYNIRGWMMGINLIKTDPLQPLDISKAFAYKIKYNNPDNPSMGTARYNGNIAEIDWTYASNNKKRYGYIYDDLNRLTKANYQEFNLTTSSTPHYYDEEVNYDLNGNITTLVRFASPIVGGTRARQVDNLKYYYENGNRSNRLLKITDNEGQPANRLGYPGGGGAISYDSNGNVKTMPDKGILQPMLYNYLNLPSHIEKNTSLLTYNYLADGTKIGKSLLINNDFENQVINTDYVGGFIYTTAYSFSLAEALSSDNPSTKIIALAGQEEALELEDKEVDLTNKTGNAVLEFFPTAEGFYDYKNFKYIYHYKDHLGNVRLSYSRDTTTGAFKSEGNDNYYPFGLNHIGARSSGDDGSSYSPSTTYKNYKYNGKELQETGMYDYGARFYMPDIGRWSVVDPMAEKYVNWSPYNYTMNNPIRFIDPNGMDIFEIVGGYKFTQNDAIDVFNLLKASNDSKGGKRDGSIGAITFGKEKVWGEAMKFAVPETLLENVRADKGHGGYNDFYKAIKNISDQSPDGIGFLGVFSHGDMDKKSGEGMIFANYEWNPEADNVYTSDLSKLGDAVDEGKIKFANYSTVYLGACNASTVYKSAKFKNGQSFALEFAKATRNSFVYGAANEHMNAVNPNNPYNTKFYPERGGTLMINYWPWWSPTGHTIKARQQVVDVVELSNIYRK